MVWIRSFQAFLADAFRPVRWFNGKLAVLTLPVVDLALFLAVGAKFGWRWAAIGALGVLVLLFGLHGIRAEHSRRVVRLSASAIFPPETLPDGREKLLMKVTNDGPTGTFIVRCMGHIDGFYEPVGDFNFPWEGQFEERRTIHSGHSDHVPIAYVDSLRHWVQVALPPTTYSGRDAQSAGPARPVKRTTVRIRIQIRDVDREAFNEFHALIQFTGSAVAFAVSETPFRESEPVSA